MSDYNYGYEEQNDPIEEHDQQYNAKTRNESNKNIKLLNEILVAQNTPQPKYVPEEEERPKKKRKGKKDKMFAFSFETLKDPLIMIVLYVILHTPQVNNLLIRNLPKKVTDPDNIFLYYGIRGAIFSLFYYLVKHYFQA